MQEGQDTGALIGVHVRIGEARRKRQRQQRQRELPPAHAGGEEHRRPHQQRDHRGAEVRLLQDQRHRRRHHQRRHDEEKRIAHALPRRAVEIACQRQHQGELHQFARLQLHASDVDPALRPFADLAEAQHRGEQQQARGIARIGEAGDGPDVDHRDREHDAEAGREAQHVPPRVRLGRAAARGIERHVAHPRERAQQQHIKPVHLPQLGEQAEARLGADQAARVDHAGEVAAATVCGRRSRRAGSRLSVSVMIARAIGPATSAPALPCSTTTAAA